MNPLLLFALIGGGLYVFSKMAAPKDELKVVERVYTDGRLDRIGVVGKEKFQDPIFVCLGTQISPAALADGYLSGVTVPYTISPNKAGIPTDLGYAYLKNVPANGPARIAAMRAKIDAEKGSWRPSAVNLGASGDPAEFLQALAKKSYEQLASLAEKISSQFQDTTPAKIAAEFGVDESTAATYITELTSSAADKLSRDEYVTNAIAKVKPVAEALLAAAITISKGDSKVDTAIGLSLGALDMATSLVPVVGQFWSVARGLADLKLMEIWDGKQEMCRDTLQGINDARARSLDHGFPVPWHATERFSPACNSYDKYGASAYRETADQVELRTLYDESYAIFRGEVNRGWKPALFHEMTGKGLNTSDAVYVKRWWALAQAFMGDMRVYEIFHVLGKDYFGGTLASDEQVMLVAAPIALANGFPIDDFAVALWKKSKGWQSVDPESLVTRNLVKVTYEGSDEDFHAVVEKYCMDLVANAWWAQWAVLARDAFELAKTYVPPLVTLSTSAFSKLKM